MQVWRSRTRTQGGLCHLRPVTHPSSVCLFIITGQIRTMYTLGSKEMVKMKVPGKGQWVVQMS